MARLIDADILLQNFDDMEPYEEYESEHDLWLDMRMEVIHAPTITPPPITGDTSDGCHTFNELYHHRAVLFSVVCNEQPDIAWKSKRHHDGTMYDGMFIVGINTPEGQATYHYYIDPYWELFRIKELEYAPEWDGHTPDEAIRRIGTLTQPNEWVSVEDALPEREKLVIVCVGGEVTVDTRLRSKTGIIGDWAIHQSRADSITHWMPLPEPPDSRPPEGEENA